MSALNKISMAIAGLFGTGNAATPLANRNLIVDGAFDQWVATSGAIGAGGTIGPTMYHISAGSGGVGNFARYDTRGVIANPFDSNASFACSYALTTGSTGTLAGRNTSNIYQNSEFVAPTAGRSVTISIKMWATAALTIPMIMAAQNFGTGGSPSASSFSDKPVNWVVGTTPKKFSVRVDMPSLIGKILGTNNNDFAQWGIMLPPGWTGTVYFGEFQVEYCNPNASSDINGAGGLPTCFEYRGYGPELARVSRYYQSFGSPFGAGTFSSATQGFYNMNFPGGPMRAAPAASFNGTFQCSYPGNNVTVAGTNMAATGQNVQASMLTAVVSGMTPGQGSVLWGNSGATVTLDARL